MSFRPPKSLIESGVTHRQAPFIDLNARKNH
jgi:hypothetical protein